MVFTFLNGWEVGETKECFVTHENYMKFTFQCSQTKFYWHTAMFIHLPIIYGCLPQCTSRTEEPQEKSYGPEKPKSFSLQTLLSASII